jgi:hypothetical protein
MQTLTNGLGGLQSLTMLDFFFLNYLFLIFLNKLFFPNFIYLYLD